MTHMTYQEAIEKALKSSDAMIERVNQRNANDCDTDRELLNISEMTEEAIAFTKKRYAENLLSAWEKAGILVGPKQEFSPQELSHRTLEI